VAVSEISLNPPRAFEVAARHLSFTPAAEDLCETPAALGHQVKTLEEHLGKIIFRRTTKWMVFRMRLGND
jgi:LysR family glycine cleavage system transcriptional activator